MLNFNALTCEQIDIECPYVVQDEVWTSVYYSHLEYDHFFNCLPTELRRCW